MPEIIAEILKKDKWTLIYQESIMKLAEKIGFTPKEADDLRRGVGKKDKKILLPFKAKFIELMMKQNISESTSEHWWKVIEDSGDYLFNRSHSVSYSFITYYCAWLKANYPAEFFTALLTIRSQTDTPKDWAIKAPEYVQEAKELGLLILPPDINISEAEFTIRGNKIFYGLSAIKGMGEKAVEKIISERKKGEYSSIFNFAERTNTNSGVFQSLCKAGAFDSFKLDRNSLAEQAHEILNFHKDCEEYNQFLIDQRNRREQNELVMSLRSELDDKIKLAKDKWKQVKKDPTHMTEEELWLIEDVDMLKKELPDDFFEGWRAKYKKYTGLRKLPELKDRQIPKTPKITNLTSLSVLDMILQAETIGCYLTKHPAHILFKGLSYIANMEEGDYVDVPGVITECRILTTKNKQQMAILTLNDGSASAKVVLFPQTYNKLQNKINFKEGIFIRVTGECSKIEPSFEIKATYVVEAKLDEA